MFVCFSREGLLQDEVSLGLVSNHNILIAQASADREPPGVIRIKLADGVDRINTSLEASIGGRSGSRGGLAVGSGLVGLDERTFCQV